MLLADRRTKRETFGRLGVLRPWTMRRLPAALNPTSWPVSGLTNTPLRLPGCAASSGGRPHAAGMRRSGAASRCARRVRLPLRGQHRLARLRCRQAPCFPFNCARRSGTREHQNACECRRRCGERQGASGARAAPGMAARRAAGRLRRQRGGSRGPDAVLSYAPRSVLARAAPASAVKRETGGGKPPGLCCPRNGTPPARRGSPARAQAARDATALRGGKAAAWQAASPDTGRRKGRANGAPNALSARDGQGAHSARACAGFARSAMPCLPAGRRCAARCPVPTATARCAPCRAR